MSILVYSLFNFTSCYLHIYYKIQKYTLLSTNCLSILSKTRAEKGEKNISCYIYTCLVFVLDVTLSKLLTFLQSL